MKHLNDLTPPVRYFSRSSHATSSLCLALIALTLCGTAVAVDGKVYPGSACHPGPLNNATQIQYTANGGAKDISAGSLIVVCPVVRDNLSSVTGISAAYVRVNKTNDTGFFCEMKSRNGHSTAGSVESQWNFEGAGNRTITLNGPASGYISGFYLLSCIIPPGHTLLSYRVDEN